MYYHNVSDQQLITWRFVLGSKNRVKKRVHGRGHTLMRQASLAPCLVVLKYFLQVPSSLCMFGFPSQRPKLVRYKSRQKRMRCPKPKATNEPVINSRGRVFGFLWAVCFCATMEIAGEKVRGHQTRCRSLFQISL